MSSSEAFYALLKGSALDAESGVPTFDFSLLGTLGRCYLFLLPLLLRIGRCPPAPHSNGSQSAKLIGRPKNWVNITGLRMHAFHQRPVCAHGNSLKHVSCKHTSAFAAFST